MKDKENSFDNRYLKEWYNKIKNNLAMILLMPTFIGGIWQVFSLLNLGFEYVRFFSVTQLVADGLLMIILIPITAILPVFAYLMLKSFNSDVNKKKVKKPITEKIISFLFPFGILLFLNYYYFNYILSIFKNEPSTFIELLAFLLFIPLIENTIVKGNKLSSHTESYIKLAKRKKLEGLNKIKIFFISIINSIFSFSYVIVIFFAAISSLITFVRVIDSLGDYFVSDNLVNLKNVEERINKKYSLSPEEYSIEYFNDSYIFIEHVTVSNEEQKKLEDDDKNIPTEIIILKFDRFFQDD